MAVPFAKRVKRTLRYWAIRGAMAALGTLSLRRASAWGARFGRLAFHFAGREQARALASLRRAFPQDSEPRLLDRIRAVFAHFGAAAFEMPSFPRLDPKIPELVAWEEAQVDELRAALAEGNGLIFVTAHLGNWELLGRRIVQTFDSPVYAIAKESSDPRITELIDRHRGESRAINAWRNQPGSTRLLLKGLRAGGVVLVLIDQDTNVQSVFVPFFGELAKTPRAAADFALHTGAAIATGYCTREKGISYRMTTRRIHPQAKGEREADVLSLTATLTRDIEEAVRRTPDQWVWWHERWKSRP